MGIAAGHVVVRLVRIETGSESLLQCEDSGGRGGRQPGADVCAGVGKMVERDKGVAEHRAEIQGAGRLIERPERFGTIRVEDSELAERRLREVDWGHQGVVERAEQREGVQPRRREPGAKVRREVVRRRHVGRFVTPRSGPCAGGRPWPSRR